jgi:hypothetical protein
MESTRFRSTWLRLYGHELLPVIQQGLEGVL